VRNQSAKPKPNLQQLIAALVTTESNDSRTLDARRAAAATALGELGDAAAVPALIEALAHPNQVCVAASLALGRLRAEASVAPLRAVLEDPHKFWMPRGAAAVALGQIGAAAAAALPALQSALALDHLTSGTSWDVLAHDAVADAIAHIKDPSAACALEGKNRYALWGF
jgi:HEAT repeat protein